MSKFLWVLLFSTAIASPARAGSFVDTLQQISDTSSNIHDIASNINDTKQTLKGNGKNNSDDSDDSDDDDDSDSDKSSPAHTVHPPEIFNRMFSGNMPGSH